MTNEYSLPRCTPESQGIAASSILNFLNAVETQIDELQSFMLLRHGAVVAEGWWSPYGPTIPHMLFSLSKSFTSTAIGLAVSENRLSVDDRVLDFFLEDAPELISNNLDAMRVRHLLSMSTGHDLDTMSAFHQQSDGNWSKAFLAVPVAYEPGTHFFYDTGASYMLSAIIQKLTGMTLLEYLGPRLLAPLGIKNATWEMSPQGVCTGGFGMNITTEDIARFGQMYLQKGMWNGQQLVPQAWVAEATSRQISNSGNKNTEWNQGYGYQFWGCRHGAYRGDGAFGQFCIVMPEQDMVVAITSGVGDMQAVMNLVWEHLLPAAGEVMADNVKDDEALKDKLSKLAYLPPQGQASSPMVASVSGNTYVIEPNDLQIQTIAFDFTESGSRIAIRDARGKHVIQSGAGVWKEGTTNLFGAYPHEVASGVWTSDDTYVITIRLYETPFVRTLTCHFTEDQLAIESDVNVAFVLKTDSLRGKFLAKSSH